MRMPATMPVHTPTHGSQQYACFHVPLAGSLTLTAAVPVTGWMLLKREIWTKCALLPGRFAGLTHLPLHEAVKCDAEMPAFACISARQISVQGGLRHAHPPNLPLWPLPPLFCPTRSRLKAVEAWQQIDDDCLSQPPETGVCSALPEP